MFSSSTPNNYVFGMYHIGVPSMKHVNTSFECFREPLSLNFAEMCADHVRYVSSFLRRSQYGFGRPVVEALPQLVGLFGSCDGIP